jgi:hypothetical protein
VNSVIFLHFPGVLLSLLLLSLPREEPEEEDEQQPQIEEPPPVTAAAMAADITTAFIPTRKDRMSLGEPPQYPYLSACDTTEDGIMLTVPVDRMSYKSLLCRSRPSSLVCRGSVENSKKPANTLDYLSVDTASGLSRTKSLPLRHEVKKSRLGRLFSRSGLRLHSPRSSRTNLLPPPTAEEDEPKIRSSDIYNMLKSLHDLIDSKLVSTRLCRCHQFTLGSSQGSSNHIYEHRIQQLEDEVRLKQDEIERLHNQLQVRHEGHRVGMK